jgi:anti-sigma B factor antagonist
MEITEDKKGDIVILALSGKLDASTSKTFEDKLLADIDSGGQRFVIDLAQLEYVSSSGLRVFLVAAKRLTSSKGKIVLCSLKDHIRQVFDLAGFSSILAIFGSRDEAFKSL